MNYLAAVGHSSNASDNYDRLRRQDRMGAMQEQAAQTALDDDALTRQIFKLAYLHEFEKDQAREAAKKGKAAIPQAPKAPVAPQGLENATDDYGNPLYMADGGMIDEPLYTQPTAGMDAQVVADMTQRSASGGLGAAAPAPAPAVDFFKARTPQQKTESDAKLLEALRRRAPVKKADGGPVGGPKFSGIYDDMAVTDRMPTIFTEYMQDMQTPGFKHGGLVGKAVEGITKHCRAMADGGMIDNGVGTPMGFADGGKVDFNSIYEYAKKMFGGAEKMADGGKVTLNGKQSALTDRQTYLARFEKLSPARQKELLDAAKAKADEAEADRKPPLLSRAVDLYYELNPLVPPQLMDKHREYRNEDIRRRNERATRAQEELRSLPTNRNVFYSDNVPHTIPASELDQPMFRVNGGPVRGPGTGTSDSVPAVGPGGQPFALSNGEYVLSADTVRAVGKDKLDALQAQHHKKVG